MSTVSSISMKELKEKLDRGDPIQIINVLSPKGWEAGVIIGSILIPNSEIEERMNELDQSKETITYCANYRCNASRNAAIKLSKKGFNVRTYEGGIQEWITAGHPIEHVHNNQ